jgi:hypothetical protein
LAFFLLVAGLAVAAAFEARGRVSAAVAQSAAEPPSAAAAAEATYLGVYETPVTLVAGLYEGEPFVPGGAARPTVGLAPAPQIEADLDGDGTIETRVVLLWETSGGSGTSLYLAAVTAAGGRATYVGDRVQVRTLRAAQSEVSLDMLRAGADDAMCCPSELATGQWRFDGDGWEATRDEITGTLDMAAVAGTWRLVVPPPEANNDGAPDPVIIVQGDSITATLEIRADGTIAGTAGCNRYSGTALLNHPNAMAIDGPLVLTRMACPEPAMRFEEAFVARLAATRTVGFMLGRLGLSWQIGDEYGLLLFESS